MLLLFEIPNRPTHTNTHPMRQKKPVIRYPNDGKYYRGNINDYRVCAIVCVRVNMMYGSNIYYVAWRSKHRMVKNKVIIFRVAILLGDGGVFVCVCVATVVRCAKHRSQQSRIDCMHTKNNTVDVRKTYFSEQTHTSISLILVAGWPGFTSLRSPAIFSSMMEFISRTSYTVQRARENTCVGNSRRGMTFFFFVLSLSLSILLRFVCRTCRPW